MPAVLRKTITFRSRTPEVDSATAAEILGHVAAYELPPVLSSREIETENGDDEYETASGVVVFADHDPETTNVLNEDATLFTATDDPDSGRVSVQFRASKETFDACIDILEHVLDITTLETDDPQQSNWWVEVQVIVNSPVEPYEVSPPEQMLFRTKRTPDGRTALRVVAQNSLELSESTDAVVEEVERGLSLADQI